MTRRRIVSSLTLMVVFASMLGGWPARATPPGRNGRIAFARTFDEPCGRAAIFTVDPDGTDQRQLTHPSCDIFHGGPDWAPDGRWIAYERQSDSHPWHIVIIRADGTHKQDLTKATCPGPLKPYAAKKCRRDWGPAWSPNGRRIAFSRFFGSPHHGTAQLMVMRADGTHVRRLTDQPAPILEGVPQWSPDGTHLVFFAWNRDRDLDAIFTVRSDGTHEHRLTRWHMNAAFSPDWSPDGRWILFTTPQMREQRPSNLWMIHPNGNGLHRVTHTGLGYFWASSSFSPDGSMIVTARAPATGDAQDAYVLNVDGTGLRALTRTLKSEGGSDWGPRR
jgi:Tol biopolymer transport system component